MYSDAFSDVSKILKARFAEFKDDKLCKGSSRKPRKCFFFLFHFTFILAIYYSLNDMLSKEIYSGNIHTLLIIFYNYKHSYPSTYLLNYKHQYPSSYLLNYKQPYSYIYLLNYKHPYPSTYFLNYKHQYPSSYLLNYKTPIFFYLSS